MTATVVTTSAAMSKKKSDFAKTSEFAIFGVARCIVCDAANLMSIFRARRCTKSTNHKVGNT